MSDKQILVIVINPEAKTIEVDTIDDNLESMQAMVGGNIDRVYADLGAKDEILWIDEEGKLKDNYHFHLRGFPDIISGKAFICQELHGEHGLVNGDTDLDVAAVQDRVTWLPHLDGQQLL